LRNANLRKKPHEVLTTVLNFIGLSELDEFIIRKGVEFSSFDNMKKLEKENFFRLEAIRLADSQDSESYKVRRGITGGYKSYLSKADIAYIDELIKRFGCPF